MQNDPDRGIIDTSGDNVTNTVENRDTINAKDSNFTNDVHKLIREEYPLTLNEAHQNKHIASTKEFDPKRSTLTANPMELIKLYAGKGEPIPTNAGEWSEKERFTHTSEIGIWRKRS